MEKMISEMKLPPFFKDTLDPLSKLLQTKYSHKTTMLLGSILPFKMMMTTNKDFKKGLD